MATRKDVTLAIRLVRGDKERLQRLAESQDRSMSNLAARMINERLDVMVGPLMSATRKTQRAPGKRP
jgi:hypothetical protein